MEEAASKLFDLMRHVETEAFSLTWRGREEEPISYKEYVAPYALILALNLVRQGKIGKEEAEFYF